jgi:hypothetical protein
MKPISIRSSRLIPRGVGLLLVARFGVQLYTFAISQIGMALHPSDSATLSSQGIASWTIYYGGGVSFVEAVVSITLGLFLFSQRAFARKALLWLLPIIVIHDLAYSAYLGAASWDRLPLTAVDVVAWLLILFWAPVGLPPKENPPH